MLSRVASGLVILLIASLQHTAAAIPEAAACAAEGWSSGRLGAPGLMAPRYTHLAFWTGSRMLVFGGSGGFNGALYDPVSDSARPISMAGAPPAPALGYTAVWTGQEMIVWGTTGTPPDLVHSAGRYDPAADTWRPVSLAGAPPALRDQRATWTGDRMVVTGGQGYVLSDGAQVLTSLVDGGGSYDPATDSWGPGPRFHRSGHAAVWTGTHLVLLGGECSWSPPSPGEDPCALLDTAGPGMVADLAAGTARSVASGGAPSLPPSFTAVWSGREVLVWGTRFAGRTGTIAAARYEPGSDTWGAMTSAGAPSPRVNHTAVWTGSGMILWGGSTPSLGGALGSGASYRPAADSWAATPAAGAPSARDAHTAVWTGSEMIVWGGFTDSAGALSTGGRYVPPAQDADGDGFTDCGGDCDDANPGVHPGADQICGDGLNNDCLDPAYPSLEGTNEGDDDGDGTSECSGDCDDTAPGVNPGAPDLPGDAVDEDCDGEPSCDSSAAWSNHGEFTACVARACRRLVEDGLAGQEECASMMRRAARAQVP